MNVLNVSNKNFIMFSLIKDMEILEILKIVICISIVMIVAIILLRLNKGNDRNNINDGNNGNDSNVTINERYGNDNRLYKNDNQYYKLGSFFLREDSPNYEIYNAYKKDVNVQPIQFPPVDYTQSFDSGLKKSNTMVAVPQPGITYVNLLNPVSSF